MELFSNCNFDKFPIGRTYKRKFFSVEFANYCKTIVSRNKLNWKKTQLGNVINYRKKKRNDKIFDKNICLLKW